MTKHRHWALAATVSEEFLNHLAEQGIGDGLEPTEVRQSFNLPMLGPLDLTVQLQITSVRFQMRHEDAGALRATIHARGEIIVHGESMMPALPGAALVSGEVLVTPRVKLDRSGHFAAVLDLANSALVGMGFDGIEGMETDADVAAQMGQMLFAAVGGEIFGGLADAMGEVGLELAPHEGRELFDLGVTAGAADIDVRDGIMVVGLPAHEGLEGSAESSMVGGTSLGVGVAAGALTSLVNKVASQALGVGLPFEMEVTARDKKLGGRVRNPRLIDSEFLPDLRPSVRSTVRPALVGEEIEFSLQEAWVELPFVLPIFNRASRMLGGVASRAPLHVRIPRYLEIPAHPDGDVMVKLRVESFDVARDGLNCVVDAVVEPE